MADPQRRVVTADDSFEAQLPILDFGNVCEFGGQPGHTPERLAIGKVVRAGGIRPRAWMPAIAWLIASGPVSSRMPDGPSAVIAATATSAMSRVSMKGMRPVPAGKRSSHC